ncbi:putative small nuclear ribonucleoprotein-associated proteins B and B'-like [Capsicum annuum]|nr:putative small nuclear ribonucleoprotein-associated proteins B and B'-like [Capsicum annuum]
MDTESVIEFLGEVPLLQRLPSSSLRKIAQLINIKHYDRGDYVTSEGEARDGIYFIWDGEAEVCGFSQADDENRPEFQLKKFDYFGHGLTTSPQPAEVIALSKLTCLVLPHEHNNLLRPKSIWNADKEGYACALVEHILNLELIEVNIFQGVTLPDAPVSDKVFGGQFLGQALAAASKTVDFLKIVHSLHAYFLLAGNFDTWQRTGVNPVPVTFRSGNATVPVGTGIPVPNDPESGTGAERGFFLIVPVPVDRNPVPVGSDGECIRDANGQPQLLVW